MLKLIKIHCEQLWNSKSWNVFEIVMSIKLARQSETMKSCLNKIHYSI